MQHKFLNPLLVSFLALLIASSSWAAPPPPNEWFEREGLSHDDIRAAVDRLLRRVCQENRDAVYQVAIGKKIAKDTGGTSADAVYKNLERLRVRLTAERAAAAAAEALRTAAVAASSVAANEVLEVAAEVNERGRTSAEARRRNEMAEARALRQVRAGKSYSMFGRDLDAVLELHGENLRNDRARAPGLAVAAKRNEVSPLKRDGWPEQESAVSPVTARDDDLLRQDAFPDWPNRRPSPSFGSAMDSTLPLPHHKPFRARGNRWSMLLEASVLGFDLFD